MGNLGVLVEGQAGPCMGRCMDDGDGTTWMLGDGGGGGLVSLDLVIGRTLV